MRRIIIVIGVVITMVLLANVFSVAKQSPDLGPVAVLKTTGPSTRALAAHRGGMGVYPQNTMRAFDAISDRHPEMALEMDVRQLGDGTLVLSHDASVVTPTGVKNLSDMTLAQWRDVRVPNPEGGSPAPPATLAEVLHKYGGGDVPLVIELKEARAADDFISSVWRYRKTVLVQSFNQRIVSRFVRSGLHTLQLSSDGNISIVPGVHSIGVENSAVTSSLIQRAHDEGVSVWVWGGDVKVSMRITDTRGVDGFIVDDPTS